MSALRIYVDATDLERLAAQWDRAPKVFDDSVGGRVGGLMMDVSADVKELTPTNQSTLKDSILHATQVRPGLGVTGIVGTSLSYAIPVELGTRPHIPPIEPILLWVKQKLGLRGREAKSAAYAIKWTIAKRGTLGVGMFHRTFARRRGEIAGVLNYAVREGLQKAFGGRP
ncbi:HK97 gp10 family phage protein [Methyloversatilis discipulorum]|uniref:HK97 gp10 family phage protein n=1 Tax=Methyloversatilis discipulorum TaxID=1119528 RepID=UPI000369922A|nr:HK97 gp10 family phage protein [Methyloversatilis discipulorum]